MFGPRNWGSMWVGNENHMFFKDSLSVGGWELYKWHLHIYLLQGDLTNEDHFTHETESPWPLHFKHSHWWQRLSRSNSASHYARGTNGGSLWLQDGCKVYMDSYMASDGSCFMVTWTIFKNHLLEVGLTQNQETMALRKLTTVGLFYYIMCENRTNRKAMK